MTISGCEDESEHGERMARAYLELGIGRDGEREGVDLDSELLESKVVGDGDLGGDFESERQVKRIRREERNVQINLQFPIVTT
jgi:hypothetical protein